MEVSVPIAHRALKTGAIAIRRWLGVAMVSLACLAVNARAGSITLTSSNGFYNTCANYQIMDVG